MSYRTETIAVAMRNLNGSYFLPAIQREFVWKPEKVIKLFDSIMRGYPIGSFLFWELEASSRGLWQGYKFLDTVHTDGTHNEPANLEAYPNVTLVLDGQQRLTSLNVALRGAFRFRRKYGKRTNPDAWTTKRLYLDLLKDPRSSDAQGDLEDGVYYRFEFLEKAPPPSGDTYWFPVGRMLGFSSDEEYEDHKAEIEEDLPPDLRTRERMSLLRRNLDRLYRAIHKDETIAYFPEREQDYDRVLDIFVRTNSGGEPLTKSDLLLSMITNRWKGVNAREEIHGFVEHLNAGTPPNRLNKDFVMKCCLVLADLPVQYRVENFNRSNLEKIEHGWEQAKSAIERTIQLTNVFGLHGENLTSANALIPIVYYLHQRPGITLLGSTHFDVENAPVVRRWLLMALLNGVFGGSSDTTLGDIRGVLRQHPTGGFPRDAVNAAVRRLGRSTEFSEETIDSILDLQYGKRGTFLALSLLYDDVAWGITPHQQDHIFPQELFKTEPLRSAAERKDRIGNLQLIVAGENSGKQDKPLADWIQSRGDGFRRRHLIPDDPALYALDKYEEFLRARENLIRARLRDLLSPGT